MTVLNSKASTDSWVAIWLGCIDVTFKRKAGVEDSGIRGIKKVAKTNKYPSSLHQSVCGEGYCMEDVYVDHFSNHRSYREHSNLGGSPSEYTHGIGKK